jgi:superfamily II DNA/RNA helicase
VLLATDAAGEGLNLHRHCRTVVNLELPWNPMRLEQRIGRVDRIGQQRRVHAVHLVARATQEEQLLVQLSARVLQAAARVGAPDPLSGRPAWTEEASARLIVLHDNPSSEAAPDADQRSRSRPTTLPLTRLVAEASDASVRLGQTRHLLARAHSGVPAWATSRWRGTLVAHTRRGATRAALMGRALAVYRTTMTDGSGRLVATRLDAAHCSVQAGPAAAAAALEQMAASVIAPEASWPDPVVDAHRAMVNACLRRLRAIDALRHVPDGESQPGLFDQRTAASAERTAQAQASADAQHADRVAAVSALLDINTDGPTLAALLLPRPLRR